MALSIDMQQVAQQAVRTLGADRGELVLELTAQQAAVSSLSERVTELEGEVAERDAEIGRLRAADELLQERIRDLEAQVAAEAPADEPLTD